MLSPSSNILHSSQSVCQTKTMIYFTNLHTHTHTLLALQRELGSGPPCEMFIPEAPCCYGDPLSHTGDLRHYPIPPTGSAHTHTHTHTHTHSQTQQYTHP